jgi:hypothetical protein
MRIRAQWRMLPSQLKGDIFNMGNGMGFDFAALWVSISQAIGTWSL